MKIDNKKTDLSKILQPGDRLIMVTVEEVRVCKSNYPETYPIKCLSDEGEFLFFSENGVGIHSKSMSLYPTKIKLPEADWSEYEGLMWNGERYEKGELVAVRDLDSHMWSIATLDCICDNRLFVHTANKQKTNTSFLQMCKIDSLK